MLHMLVSVTPMVCFPMFVSLAPALGTFVLVFVRMDVLMQMLVLVRMLCLPVAMFMSMHMVVFMTVFMFMPFFHRKTSSYMLF